MTKWQKYIRSAPVRVETPDHKTVWHKINGPTVNQPIRRDEHVYFEFSPYDVPEAVSGEVDRKHGIAKVRFKYINDEPVNRVDMSDFVVYLGKSSNRLHRVEIETKAVPQKDLVSAVLKALEQLRNRQLHAPPDRYDIAREIVSDVGDKLLEQVA